MIKDLILKKHFMNFRDAWQITDKDEAAVFEKFVNCVILSQDEANTFVGNLNLLDVCCTGGGDDAKLDIKGNQTENRHTANYTVHFPIRPRGIPSFHR